MSSHSQQSLDYALVTVQRSISVAKCENSISVRHTFVSGTWIWYRPFQMHGLVEQDPLPGPAVTWLDHSRLLLVGLHYGLHETSFRVRSHDERGASSVLVATKFNVNICEYAAGTINNYSTLCFMVVSLLLSHAWMFNRVTQIRKSLILIYISICQLVLQRNT
jgi:hypothetical protein